MAYIRVMHPLTSLAVAIVTMAIAVPAGEAPISYHVLRVGLVMLLIQFSIGVHNDLLDQQYDAQAKPLKPIPAGLIKQRTAIALFIVLLSGALALSPRFGPVPFAIMLFGLACGLGYNVGLKRTAFSWLPHSLAAPTILVWSRAINDSASPILLWAYPLGMLLGPALNVANQLPGAEAARASGEFSLLHHLGPVKGRRIAGGLFLLTAILMPLVVIGHQREAQTAVVGSSIAVVITGIFMVLAERDYRVALWPTAVIIAAVLGMTFHLSI
ncbi:MAG: UbiA family prenyltransferase [Candidatus Neomarinimicrobiota bacterium]